MNWLPEGPIGTPDEMRPRLELWRRQQAALAAGEDPTLLETEFAPVSSARDTDATQTRHAGNFLNENNRENWNHNPEVGGSTPSPATKKILSV